MINNMMIIDYNIGSDEDLDKKVMVSFLPACIDTGSHWCTEEREGALVQRK